MRFPRASAVIVALSTFVAVATVAALVSQLSPLDRAGAVLPEGAITTTAQPVDALDEVEAPAADDAPPESGSGADDSASDNADSEDAGAVDQGSTADGATVVAPAPAEPVTPDPEPSSSSAPGNSGNAPGHSGSPGNSGNAPDQSKP